MATISYDLLRALELEGRHPVRAGIWQVTLCRLEAGEGCPLPFDADYLVEIPGEGPLPAAPTLPADRRKRTFYYRRVRSSGECELLIRQGKMSVPVSVELFAGWANPEGGQVSLPVSGEPALPTTHRVSLGACDSTGRRFAFRNTWGEGWGRQGCGFLPHEYVDRHCFEAWVAYRSVRVESSKVVEGAERKEGRWTVRDEMHRRRYGFELWHEPTRERLAWAFVVENDDTLEVEEFYVRPEYRGQGHARHLAGMVRSLAQGKRQPLRLWVPFADCRQEAPTTFPALAPLARHLGLQFQPCPVRWAAYLATDEQPGASNPIEPAWIPARPQASLGDVTAR